MLNRFAVFIIIGVIGYLAYSSLNEPVSTKAAENKNIPVITKKMISPVLIEPENRASPIDRDPFASSWNNISPVVSRQVGGSDDNSKNPAFSEKLMGILGGSDGQNLALIGGEVYGVDSSVNLSDSGEPWQVSSIDDESVVLTRDGIRKVLRITDNYNDTNDSNDIQAAISATEAEKEFGQ
ncbi:MAG: hypothetical protein WC496_11665 [Phycisphaerae bacterium]